MASASAIADALVTNLSAASVLGSGNVSKHSYQVLESSPCACGVVTWVNMQSVPVQFGAYSAQDNWTFLVQLFLRDTGRAEDVLQRTYSVPQLVLDSLKSDPTLQDTCIKIDTIGARMTPGEAATIGGHSWIEVPFTIQVTATW